MVLLAPTVTALQILLEVCRAYAGPHDIVCNTTKTVCMLVRPKESQGRFSTRVRLGNEEHSFVKEFRYLGHIMTADCRDDKDIKKQLRSQNAVYNMLVRKFSFAPIEPKTQLFKSQSIDTPIMDVLFGVIHSRSRIIKSIYNHASHCLPCNWSHNVVNRTIGIIEAFSNVNIVAKLLAKLQEIESSSRCTYNGFGVVKCR